MGEKQKHQIKSFREKITHWSEYSTYIIRYIYEIFSLAWISTFFSVLEFCFAFFVVGWISIIIPKVCCCCYSCKKKQNLFRFKRIIDQVIKPKCFENLEWILDQERKDVIFFSGVNKWNEKKNRITKRKRTANPFLYMNLYFN